MRRAAMPVVVLTALLFTGCAPLFGNTPAVKSFDVVETGIPELQKAMAEGRLTSRQLVVEYLTRIALYEDQVKAIIVVNPKALDEAERAGEQAPGPAAIDAITHRRHNA